MLQENLDGRYFIARLFLFLFFLFVFICEWQFRLIPVPTLIERKKIIFVAFENCDHNYSSYPIDGQIDRLIFFVGFCLELSVFFFLFVSLL